MRDDRRPWEKRPALFSRRAVLLGAAAGAGLAALRPSLALAEDVAHGFSPLGRLKYPSDFAAFAFVRPDAPKGGTLRLARADTFDSLDTLRYPGRPPADLTLILDRLAVGAADEPASIYGLLAETIEVSDDLSVAAFRLREAARWHDGRPITADDVLFTFETLKAEGAPFYRQALSRVTASAADGRTIAFRNAEAGDRDFPALVGRLPIHPAHVWRTLREPRDFAALLGSGPYRVAAVDRGDRLALERVADYWARDLAVNRGRWNFDTLVFDYYRDQTVAVEAFRGDRYDVREEQNAQTWANAYRGPAFDDGRIKRIVTRDGPPGRLQGLVFNLRRPLLADIRIREAVSLVHDPDWVLRNLFAGLYGPVGGTFGDTALSATGAMTEGERAILAPHLAGLPPALSEMPDPLAGRPKPGSRAALGQAIALLDAAGLPKEGTRRLDPATGRPLILTLVTTNPALRRAVGPLAEGLAAIGLALDHLDLEPVSASRRILDHDYDLASISWAPSLLPGQSERLLWGSALADQPGSYALSGAKDAALDAAIAAMLKARDEAAIVAGARAFDRVLRWRRYMLPLWRSDATWLAYWDRFGMPATTDTAQSPIDRWWRRDGTG